ncbi:hypothetical protein D3C72_1364380 [compost metagenome]
MLLILPFVVTSEDGRCAKPENLSSSASVVLTDSIELLERLPENEAFSLDSVCIPNGFSEYRILSPELIDELYIVARPNAELIVTLRFVNWRSSTRVQKFPPFPSSFVSRPVVEYVNVLTWPPGLVNVSSKSVPDL